MGTPMFPSVDSDSKQFPDAVRARVAANLADSSTVEGQAAAALVTQAFGKAGLPVDAPHPLVAAITGDEFEDANGTALAAHQTTVGQKTWTAHIGTFATVGDRLQSVSSNDGDLASYDAGALASATITATVYPATSNGGMVAPALVFRLIDPSNFWYLTPNAPGSGVYLYRVTSGSHSLILDVRAPDIKPGAAYDLRVDLYGPDITVWVGGVEIATVTDAGNIAGTRVGVRLGKNGGATGPAQW